MNLRDTVHMLFMDIPPRHVYRVGEWNQLMLFLERNEVGLVEVEL